MGRDYMLKSVKSKLVLSFITSLLFIIYTFLNFNHSYTSTLIANVFLFVTLASVFNTGILIQQYMYAKGRTIK